MRKRLFGKLKQNSAFTMMEMLVVVAITVVLMGVSMLGISQLATRLKMAELDNQAKTIYLEAQNQLSAIEVEGGLPRLYDEMMSDYSARFLTEKAPQDYNVELGDEDWKQLCYVHKADTITKENLILEKSSTYQMGGNYLIELNPQTGDIYGVFYWEEDTQIAYTTVVQALEDRNLKSRIADKLGYYGGQTQTTIATGIDLDQQVELINSEELYLKVSMDASSRLLKYYRYPNALTIQCVITDESGNSWETTLDVNKAKENDRLEFYLLLDSLEDGKSFTDITENKLVAGDNLTVSVKSEFEQGAYYCIEESIPLVTNSLFAEKTLTHDGTTIEIETLRHLRNLQCYVHDEEAGDRIKILQCDDIDFDSKNFSWTSGEFVGVGQADRPIAAISPIENETLFDNSGDADVTTVDGNDFEIKNIVIKTTKDNAGLFASAKNVTFINVKLEDITVNAADYDNVGALTGAIDSCSVEDCGVYLTTYSEKEDETKQYYCNNIENEGAYENEMLERYNTRTVSGDTNVGALFGAVSNTTITNSFGAVKVVGSTNVGGFIGNVEDTIITNCYSSGNVVSNDGFAGGFLGCALDITVDNAYSTSNVYGHDIYGGFLGRSKNSTYNNCYAYGEVLDETGSVDGLSNAGGFIHKNHSVSNLYNNCKFLRQNAYNTTNLVDSDAIVAQGYSNFVASGDSVIGAGESYPYDATLLHKVFPFEPVTKTHYGDWPVQYIMNTSLVYYEKYDNGEGNYSYGYYCIAKLTSKEETSITNDYVWVLDTLEDRECVEDGYALLSTHNLSKFSYDLHIGSVEEVSQSGTLTVGYEGDEAADKAINLRQQSSLEFKAYTEQKSDYSQDTPVEVFSISGMYLYQLPYELQCTARTGVDNFYDRFVLHSGYAKGNDAEGATPVIGGTQASEGLNFFYCPHFAKTAVNPGTDGSDESTLLNPEYVYVRSARQLNALGRNSYYWNDKQGMAEGMVFKQETDVNFGAYTKEYCGHAFDLMDTSEDNEVRNVPIGAEARAESAGQFRNTYDGQCNRIIDYCVYSNEQYVGLFGEIQSATLINIVMTVSEKNAGRITAEYYDPNNTDDARTGVGALVGYAYQSGNTIQNCAAEGYLVEYNLRNDVIPDGSGMPMGIAMGGLVGFSLCDIGNCAAVNDVVLNMGYSWTGSRMIFIGGLIGSYFYSDLVNSYSGGSIDVKAYNGYDPVATTDGFSLRIAALCPGYLNNDAGSETSLSGTANYYNLYSYTKMSDNVVSMLKNNNFDYFCPLVSRMVWSKTFGTGCNSGMKTGGTYYLDSVLSDVEALVDTSDAYNRYRRHYCMHVNTVLVSIWKTLDATCAEINYTNLCNLSATKIDIGNSQFDGYEIYVGRVTTAENSYHRASALDGQIYPFPAVITNENGEYVHYGDWVLENGTIPEDEPEEEESLGGELLEGSGFKIGYANNTNAAKSNIKEVDLYKLGDSTYYFEFSLTEEEIAKGNTLYILSPIPDLLDVGGSNSGKQVYLEFSTTGYMSGKCTCKSNNSNPEPISGVTLEANTTYVFYFEGVVLSEGENNKNITWKIIEK